MVSFQPHISVIVNLVAVIAQKWISVKSQGKSLNSQSQAGGMLDREAYASLAFIRPPMVPRLRPMALMAYGTNCGSSHAVWLSLAEYCILCMSEKTNPLCGNKTWRNPSSSRRRACSRLPCPTLPSVDAQTSRSWIQNIGWEVKWGVTILVLTWHDMTNK